MRTPPTNGHLEASSRRASTERRILDGAMALLAEGMPWHQLGIRQIADRAEISRTAFYDFFGSKNEILQQLIRRLHDDLGSRLVESTPWRADDIRSPILDLLRVRSILATLDAFIEAHGAIYRAFLDGAREDPELDALWEDLVGAYVAVVARAIDDLRARSADVPTTPASSALAWSLVMMTERMMLLLGREALSDRDEHLDALAVVWERALFGTALRSPAAGT